MGSPTIRKAAQSECAAQATTDGISIAELKEAAGGDLEQYLVDRQNALTDTEVKRVSDKTD